MQLRGYMDVVSKAKCFQNEVIRDLGIKPKHEETQAQLSGPPKFECPDFFNLVEGARNSFA